MWRTIEGNEEKLNQKNASPINAKCGEGWGAQYHLADLHRLLTKKVKTAGETDAFAANKIMPDIGNASQGKVLPRGIDMEDRHAFVGCKRLIPATTTSPTRSPSAAEGGMSLGQCAPQYTREQATAAASRYMAMPARR